MGGIEAVTRGKEEGIRRPTERDGRAHGAADTERTRGVVGGGHDRARVLARVMRDNHRARLLAQFGPFQKFDAVVEAVGTQVEDAARARGFLHRVESYGSDTHWHRRHALARESNRRAGRAR